MHFVYASDYATARVLQSGTPACANTPGPATRRSRCRWNCHSVPPGGLRADEDRGRDVNVQTGRSLGACIGISRGLPPCGVRVTGLLISRHPGYVVLSSICSRLICGGCCISQHPTTVRNLANSDRRIPDTLLAILCHFAVCGDTDPGSGGLRIWRGSSSLVTVNHVEG
jgi:hypothetical protein